ncbi:MULTISPECIES: pheA operon leader peptide PheL [Erwinia]|uniref:PheA operon leader peptide PheL n=1 Tax=Erwinia pyrifoliae TaxID=79967 RepID=A0ABY5XDD8_ERWPY|nr:MULTISPECIES: pheA operon leader peptide PheL [Erwinia]MCA8877955.1 hypothetical protein [Erwinia pyrifoliae]MCT2386293.1 pheA operon leader peptide PheL [Erwinia pyrifoliae]MCU8588110.1 pheA operon leader peptide PheL [Erwinia pyrifoliae]UWS31713.1 pheA operon leader peptide PheL [Erwinia pyrifoliae]UWS35361.1 pheA operon leader peptide PheL [Erwinia pyrifoliae]
MKHAPFIFAFFFTFP